MIHQLLTLAKAANLAKNSGERLSSQDSLATLATLARLFPWRRIHRLTGNGATGMGRERSGRPPWGSLEATPADQDAVSSLRIA